MSWLTRFEIPIDLPNGRQALTLKDAADFLAALPEVESEQAQKESAMEALILCSKGAFPELARVALLKALNQSVVVELDKRRGSRRKLPGAIDHHRRL